MSAISVRLLVPLLILILIVIGVWLVAKGRK